MMMTMGVPVGCTNGYETGIVISILKKKERKRV
jgi:hypothetical protein